MIILTYIFISYSINILYHLSMLVLLFISKKNFVKLFDFFYGKRDLLTLDLNDKRYEDIDEYGGQSFFGTMVGMIIFSPIIPPVLLCLYLHDKIYNEINKIQK